MPVKLLGEHSFQLKKRFYTEKDVRKTSRPGDMLTEMAGDRAARPDELLLERSPAGGPRYGWFIGTHDATKNIVTFADTWRPTRHLTVTPSLSHVWATGGNSNGERGHQHAGLGARAGRGLGRHPRRSHRPARQPVSSYVDLDVGSIARHTIGGQTSRRCRVEPGRHNDRKPIDRNCVYSGGDHTQHHRPALRAHRASTRRAAPAPQS